MSVENLNSQNNESYYGLFEVVNGSLRSLVSDLSPEQQEEVVPHLQPRPADKMEEPERYVTLTIEKSSYECFYTSLAPQGSKIYLVAFLAQIKGALELFTPDLAAYVKQLAALMMMEEELDNVEELERHLTLWFSRCILYPIRTTELLQNRVANLLHVALYDGELHISADPEIKWDIERFVEACRLSNLIHHLKVANLKLEVKVSPVDNAIQVSTTEVPDYCHQWANRILAVLPDKDPVLIRKLLELFQLKTVQDLNTLKRLIKKSENDYYALHKVYQCLKTCGYHQVLLHSLKQEAAAPSSLEVIEFLEEYIREHGGSTIP